MALAADPDLHAAVVERLRAGHPLDGLDLEQIDGRWDLGGLTIDDPVARPGAGIRVGGTETVFTRVTGVTELADRDLTDLDLTGAHLPSAILTRCIVRNCVFDGANLDGIYANGTAFQDCRFDKASLREALIGGPDGRRRTTFDRCTFHRTKMRGAIPASAVYTDCDFVLADLKGVEFRDATLHRCRFEGRLEDVIFCGRRRTLGLFGHEESLIDVDFTQASFRWVSFQGLNLDRVTLPADADHIVFGHPKCVLQRVLADLRLVREPDADQRAFTAVIDHEIRRSGPAQSQAILAIRDLAESEARRSEFASMIREAERACDAGLGR